MRQSTRPSLALVAARYELVRELHVDAEVVAWEAFDAALDRPVLVQLLRPELAHDALAIERFWQQARAAARTSLPVGERVLDAGTDPETGRLFVVREWPTAERRVAAPVVGRLEPSAQAGVDYVRRGWWSLASVVRRFSAWPRWLVQVGCVILVVLLVAAIRPGVEGWLAWINTPSAGSPQNFGLPSAIVVPASGAQPGQTAVTPAVPPTVAPAARSAAAPTAVPTRAATSTPVRAGQARRIVNTDGRGVALRAAAGGDRLPGKGYDEGATVQAFEQDGEWTRIRGSDGREGWVLTVTLAP